MFLYYETKLSNVEFGNYVLYVSYIPLLHAIFSFHAEKFLNTKYYSVQNREKFYTEMVLILVRIWIIVFVLSLVLFVYIELIWMLLLFLVFSTVLLELKYAIFRLAQNYKTFNRVILVEIVSFVFLSLVALELKSYKALIGAILLSKIISYMVFYIPIDWKTKVNINFNQREFFKFVAPISVSAIGLWFYQNYDRQIISSTFGIQELSDYGVKLKIASTIGLLSGAFYTFTAPLYYKNINLNKQNRARQVTLIMYLFPSLIAVLVYGVFKLGFPSDKNGGLMILYFLVLTYSSIVSMKIMAVGKTLIISIFNILAGITAFILMSRGVDSITEVLWIKVFVMFSYYCSISLYRYRKV